MSVEMPGNVVGVVGAGTIGVGVAHVFAASNRDVVLVDVDEGAFRHVADRINELSRLQKLVTAGRQYAPPQLVLSKIRTTTDISLLSDALVVVENVVEDWSVKRDVFSKLSQVCHANCILASNTSAIPITRIASAVARPQRVIGVHFMNPPPLKNTVEVIRGDDTSDETVAKVMELLADIGKDGVVVNDSPGFVSNRILMLVVNESASLVQEGVASPEQVDMIFKKCFGHPMGPLETADLIGIDTIVKTLEVLEENLASDRFTPCALLRQKVDSGALGRKTKRGFYNYGEQ